MTINSLPLSLIYMRYFPPNAIHAQRTFHSMASGSGGGDDGDTGSGHSTEFEVNSTTLIISCVAEMCPDPGLTANAGNDSLNCCLASTGFLSQ